MKSLCLNNIRDHKLNRRLVHTASENEVIYCLYFYLHNQYHLHVMEHYRIEHI